MKLKLKTKKTLTARAGRLLGLCFLGAIPVTHSRFWKNRSGKVRPLRDSAASGAVPGEPGTSSLKCQNPPIQSRMSPASVYSSLVGISDGARICFDKQAD